MIYSGMIHTDALNQIQEKSCCSLQDSKAGNTGSKFEGLIHSKSETASKLNEIILALEIACYKGSLSLKIIKREFLNATPYEIE